MRLELVVSNAPVLDGHVWGQEFRAVALGEVRLQHEIAGQEAPGLGIPMHAGAAHTLGHQKCAPSADRQRRLTDIITKGKGRLRRLHEQIVPYGIAQLVRRIAPYWR
jgi:hypothetical protein